MNIHIESDDLSFIYRGLVISYDGDSEEGDYDSDLVILKEKRQELYQF